LPVSWNGHIVSFSSGSWRVDQNDTRAWDAGDVTVTYGTSGDRPIVGRWGSDAAPFAMGVYRSNGFKLDADASNTENGADVWFQFGSSTHQPFSGEFNSNHQGWEVGTFDNGNWYIDFNGNHVWDGVGNGDVMLTFGQSGDIPVVTSDWGWQNPCIP
jgi:hypothetical protein